MSGVFDNLNDRIGGQGEDRGISPLDLAALPPKHRQLMRFMVREVEMGYLALIEMADDEWEMSRDELDTALEALTRDSWLIQLGEENITYEANLRRKTGSTLAKSIWAGLDARIEEARRQREEAASEQDEE